MDPQVAPTESLGALIRGILNDLRTLIREEIALARVEIREQAGRARGAAMSFGMAAAALAFGGTFLLIAIAMGIADLLNWPAWTGFLIVAVLLSAVGLFTLSSGRKQLQAFSAVPEETVTTLKENSEWIAKRLSSERR
jgi:MFS family permease